MLPLKYLAGYSPTILAQLQTIQHSQVLAEILLKKYPQQSLHDIKTDKALYRYVMDLKQQYMRQSSPISKVIYDDKIDQLHQALGLHSFVPRIQGSQIKTKNEIRIGSVFKTVPLAFLKMITVHELAHLKEKQHNKAFYQLCAYMEPEYHQLEFDLRLYLSYLDSAGQLYK